MITTVSITFVVVAVVIAVVAAIKVVVPISTIGLSAVATTINTGIKVGDGGGGGSR